MCREPSSGGAGLVSRAVAARCAALASVSAVTLLALPAAAAALTISPLAGTPDASPDTQVSFLGIPPSEIADVTVVGSRSGLHRGRLAAYASAPGASFLPARPFVEGESVRVAAIVGPRGRPRRVGTSFTVAREASYGPASAPLPANTTPPPAGAVLGFSSQPALHPQSVQVLADSPEASPGDLFLAPEAGPGQYGPMIVEGDGALVWFRPAPAGQVAANLQVQRFEGRPVLTWWQGRILSVGVGLGTDEIYDSRYRRVAQVSAGNGYAADLHDLQLTPAGSAFITAYSPVRADLSSVGGSRDGTLLDAIVQEVDVRTGLVMFEWHAYGHVELSDSFTHPTSASWPWDWFHVNSISLDPWGDGDLLVSSRNTWAAYEVSAHTGSILWRIGGRRPSFRMGPGTGIAWQHDVRWQADHTITVFDDGALPRVHSQSRAIRLQIDWSRHAVELVGRDVHTPALLAGSQGDDEVLGDGDSFVGWGEQPFMTEFGASGSVLFDARLPAGGMSYRAFRFPWSATPAEPPALALSPGAPGSQTAYASWNGATGVNAWRILAGASAGSLGPVATVPRTGFETAIPLHVTAALFEAQALGPGGAVLASSAPVPG